MLEFMSFVKCYWVIGWLFSSTHEDSLFATFIEYLLFSLIWNKNNPVEHIHVWCFGVE